MRLLLLILLIMLVVGVMPTFPYSRTWGWAPAGGLGAAGFLLLLVILVLSGGF
jgi:hypothetical protein